VSLRSNALRFQIALAKRSFENKCVPKPELGNEAREFLDCAPLGMTARRSTVEILSVSR